MDTLEKWDIIIVGAGILGMASAKTIIEENPDLSILVIDKYPSVGQGNTAKSNACYRNVFSTKTNIKLCNASVSYYRHLQEDMNRELGLQEFGYLWLLSKDQFLNRKIPSIQLDNGQEISFLDFLKLNQVEFEVIEKSILHEMLPSLKMTFNQDPTIFSPVEISHGLLGKQCGALSPDLLVKAYEEMYLAKGGQVVYNCEVTQILLKEKKSEFDEDYVHTVWRNSEIGGIKVLINNIEKIILCDKLILATGAWIQQLLDPIGIDSFVRPKKRQLFRMCNLDDLVSSDKFPTNISSIPFVILPVGGVFIKPIPAAMCADVGCSDDIDRRFETRISPQMTRTTAYNPYLDDPKGEIDFYIYNILPILQAYFPSHFAENKRIEPPGAGMYAYSLDKNPVIDKVENLGNLFICSGASGSGIMKADGIARMMNSLINNEEFAILYDGSKLRVKDFSLKYRNMEKEKMVL